MKKLIFSICTIALIALVAINLNVSLEKGTRTSMFGLTQSEVLVQATPIDYIYEETLFGDVCVLSAWMNAGEVYRGATYNAAGYYNIVGTTGWCNGCPFNRTCDYELVNGCVRWDPDVDYDPNDPYSVPHSPGYDPRSLPCWGYFDYCSPDGDYTKCPGHPCLQPGL